MSLPFSIQTIVFLLFPITLFCESIRTWVMQNFLNCLQGFLHSSDPPSSGFGAVCYGNQLTNTCWPSAMLESLQILEMLKVQKQSGNYQFVFLFKILNRTQDIFTHSERGDTLESPLLLQGESLMLKSRG